MADDELAEVRRLKRWERLEVYLFDHNKEGTDFSVHEYAEVADLEVEEASGDIQAYLAAQRSKTSTTLYVLHRTPDTRTRNARWGVGVRTKDLRLIGDGATSDLRAHLERAVVPDLGRTAEINPRVRGRTERITTSLLDGALVLFAAAAQGMTAEEDDD